jgi:hypothetical protein
MFWKPGSAKDEGYFTSHVSCSNMASIGKSASKSRCTYIFKCSYFLLRLWILMLRYIGSDVFLWARMNESASKYAECMCVWKNWLIFSSSVIRLFNSVLASKALSELRAPSRLLVCVLDPLPRYAYPSPPPHHTAKDPSPLPAPPPGNTHHPNQRVLVKDGC